jgi:hypothetical protein
MLVRVVAVKVRGPGVVGAIPVVADTKEVQGESPIRFYTFIRA